MRIRIDPARQDLTLEGEMTGYPASREYPLECDFLEPVHLTYRCVSEEEYARVSGRIHAVLGAECARCLAPVRYPIDVDFAETFKKGEPDESDEYTYTGEEIELDKMLLDVISMALPMRFLCREDCKGLCPKCGADRNKVDCGCDTSPEGLNPFDKLKDLF